MRLSHGIACVVLSIVPGAGLADPSGVTEYAIEYPGHRMASGQGHHGSTHEITFDAARGGALWITGQNDDMVVRLAADGEMTFHAMPEGSGPHGIEFDAAGRLWVTFEFLGEIAELGTDGQVLARHDVRIDCAGCAEPLNPHPHGLGIDPDGETVWFTGKSTNTIGRLRRDGTVETFPLATVGSVPIYIKAGPDGAMWFTELVGNAVGRITADGVVSEFPIPTSASRPIAIVPDPNGGAMWFTEEAGNKVGRIAIDGTITEFPVPKAQDGAILAGLAFDGASNLWVQQYDGQGVPGTDYVVRIDKAILTAEPSDISGIPFTFHAVPTDATVMHRIIEGPDGAMWFTELGPDRVGRIEAP
jgi:virginiamycin B lyase